MSNENNTDVDQLDYTIDFELTDEDRDKLEDAFGVKFE